MLDTLSTGLDSSLVLLRANIVLHSKRFTGYIGIWHWVSRVVSQKLKTGFTEKFCQLELVEVPIVVENESLPLVLTAEVQLAWPLWLVVIRFCNYQKLKLAVHVPNQTCQHDLHLQKPKICGKQ